MTRPRQDERGSALVEMTWLMILLLVPLVYIVLAVFEVQRAAFATTAAARAAGRAYTVAPDEAAAPGAAQAAADLALTDQGLPPGSADLSVSCTPDPANCLAPGEVVTVSVASRVELPLMPSVFGEHTPSIAVSGVHTVPYGTFREDR